MLQNARSEIQAESRRQRNHNRPYTIFVDSKQIFFPGIFVVAIDMENPEFPSSK